MKDNILASKEAEIGFSFYLPVGTDGRQISEFAIMLRDEGSYY